MPGSATPPRATVTGGIAPAPRRATVLSAVALAIAVVAMVVSVLAFIRAAG